MKIELFDHVERADRPIATTLDERLKFAAAADEAGIYCLSVAEHRVAPLSLVPVPLRPLQNPRPPFSYGSSNTIAPT